MRPDDSPAPRGGTGRRTLRTSACLPLAASVPRGLSLRRLTTSAAFLGP